MPNLLTLLGNKACTHSLFSPSYLYVINPLMLCFFFPFASMPLPTLVKKPIALSHVLTSGSPIFHPGHFSSCDSCNFPPIGSPIRSSHQFPMCVQDHIEMSIISCQQSYSLACYMTYRDELKKSCYFFNKIMSKLYHFLWYIKFDIVRILMSQQGRGE